MERRSFTLAAVGALLAGYPLPAFAQGPARGTPQGTPVGSPLGDMLSLRSQGPGAQAPVAARYQAENVAFTFDRTGPSVRFEGAREIIALARQPAPMGGALYVNDVGEPVLRVSGLGGMTLFTAERPQGMPVAFVAMAAPNRLDDFRPDFDLGFWMRSVSSRITRQMGMRRQVAVIGDLDPKTPSALVADALTLAEQAFRKNAQRQRLRERMEHIDTVLVKDEGAGPAVRVTGHTLEIIIVPAKGLAGRPSSEKIARALAR